MTSRHQNHLTPERNLELLCPLAELVDCSLARYLSYARPWTPQQQLPLVVLVRRLGHEHKTFATKIAQLIVARQGTFRPSVFPMDFTSYNDLSLEYLAPRLLEQQRRLIE